MWDFPLFPERAAVSAHQVDALYWALVLVSGFFATLIFVLMTYFAIRYYHAKKVNRTIVRKDYIKLELAWTLIPLAIAMVIFVWGAKLYLDLQSAPPDATEIYVVGKQWMWKIQHPQGNREINELHVPLGQPIKLIMTSQDVIHSFFIPAFRVKQDVLPGRFTTLWFQADKAGTYHLFCAEYCGTNHSRMIGKVVVMEQQDFQHWLATGSSDDVAMASTGEQLFTRFGCASCHEQGPTSRGPSLVNLYGSRVTLADGKIVTADVHYLRESIIDPRAKLVAGYAPIMPIFRNQVSQEQLTELIEYIKSMSLDEVASNAAARDAVSGKKIP